MAFIGKTLDFLLHLSAGEGTFYQASQLRKSMTEAEVKLWHQLKNRKLNGMKFRRQHPIRWYVADFYCHEKRLIIEIDGEIHKKHNVIEHDVNRSAELDRLGIRVLRFTNKEVMTSIDLVLKRIVDFANNQK